MRTMSTNCSLKHKLVLGLSCSHFYGTVFRPTFAFASLLYGSFVEAMMWGGVPKES